MKHLCALGLWLLIAGQAFGQSSFEQIVEAEKKEAAHIYKSERSGAENNDNIIYHRIELFANPQVDYIKGRVTTYFIATTAMQSIGFDLTDSLHVDSVYYHGAMLSFSHAANVININLPVTINTGQTDSICVYYEGVPGYSGFGSFVQTYHNDTVPVIWTLSEPYGAKDWWPCKQDLADKIDSFDILVTTPQQYKVASNGLLMEVTHQDTFATWHWKHRYPIATYLVCFAVTNFDTFYNYVPFHGDTLPVVNFVWPEHLNDAQNGTPLVVPAMQLYDSLFGRYPFDKEKYGMTEFGWGGGMEHQTMTFLTDFGFELITHELAHHWFGDKVTCGSWSEIWLNEGFATYLTALCYENIAPQYYKLYKSQKITSATLVPDGSVYCYDTSSVNNIFNGSLSYSKGGMVLNMLRWELGDSLFFLSLRNYLADTTLAYRFATTPDLERHFEETSGRDFSGFFSKWVYGKGFPSYQITWSQDFSNHVTLTIHQTQSDPSASFFDLPLPLQFKNDYRDTTITFNNTY
ncbi:MAG TPA: M1 family metallopeptidase, partial [Chitinophagales bacterium]|nr:M1 family metallopeptidase [Chitinophagales bacterium]